MLTGVKKFWIEEGGSLSDETLKTLTSSIRLSASEVEQVNRGEIVEMPEILISMNRGKTTDPISQRLLKRAEPDLKNHGIYEDDLLLVVQANWDDIPRSWFMASGLNTERLDDKKNLDDAEYEHKWNGAYADTVKDAIIKPEWFDACVDAHIKLGFDDSGGRAVTFDPSDSGDPRGLADRKGSVFKQVMINEEDDINDSCDWSTDYARSVNADSYMWDSDGVGLALRRDIHKAFEGCRISLQAFNGNSAPHFSDEPYEDPQDLLENEEVRGKKIQLNKDVFFNARAQGYWFLRDRIFKTYQAVKKNKYTDPGEMISFSSNIERLDILRAEICSVPKKHNNNGKIQLLSKKDMKAKGIPSPNMADCCAMSMVVDFNQAKIQKRTKNIDYSVPERKYF